MGDQVFPVALLEESVTLPPEQNDTGPPALITGTGGREFTEITIGEDVPTHPFPSVSVTKYEPGEVTTIDCVVWLPGDHTFPDIALEVRVTSFPEQNVVDPPALIAGEGSAFTTTFTGEDVTVQKPLSTVTE